MPSDAGCVGQNAAVIGYVTIGLFGVIDYSVDRHKHVYFYYY
jgi:hypothetical protein